MYLECQISSSYYQIYFANPNQEEEFAWSDADSQQGYSVGKEYLTVQTDWTGQAREINVTFQDSTPNENFVCKGKSMIFSATKEFELSHPTSPNGGINFLADKEEFAVTIYSDRKELPTHIVFVIENVELVLIADFSTQIAF